MGSARLGFFQLWRRGALSVFGGDSAHDLAASGCIDNSAPGPLCDAWGKKLAMIDTLAGMSRYRWDRKGSQQGKDTLIGYRSKERRCLALGQNLIRTSCVLWVWLLAGCQGPSVLSDPLGFSRALFT